MIGSSTRILSTLEKKKFLIVEKSSVSTKKYHQKNEESTTMSFCMQRVHINRKMCIDANM